jgi:plasmid maintenance system antidote protein VapI
MSSKLLLDVGKALYGDQWQVPLAHDLGVSYRHLRRLVFGAADLSPPMAMRLWWLCEERQLLLDHAVDRLRSRVSEAEKEERVSPAVI